MALAQSIVFCLGAYLAIGAGIALLFLIFGVGRLDEAAKGTSIFFRVTIFFGCVLLWPYIVLRWLSGRKINKPIEERE